MTTFQPSMMTSGLMNGSQIDVATSTVDHLSGHQNSAGSSAGSQGQGSTDEYLVASDIINLYVLPIVFVAGVVSNILIVLLMRRPNVRACTVSVYFTTIAVSDTVVLFMDTLENWLQAVFKLQLKLISDVSCRLFRFFFLVAIYYSSFTLMVVAIERVLAVVRPLQASRWNSRRKATITSAVVLFVAAAINCDRLWAYGLGEEGCKSFPGHRFYASYVAPWLMITLYSILPFVVLTICNTILIINLAKAERKRRGMTNATAKGKNEKQTETFTLTALVICLSYIVCTTPNAIYYVLEQVFQWDRTNGMVFAESIINLVGTITYCSNLGLYVLSSRRFRKEFLEMFSCLKCEGHYQTPMALPSSEEGNKRMTVSDENHI